MATEILTIESGITAYTPSLNSIVRDSNGYLYALYTASNIVKLRKSTDNGENWSDVSTDVFSKGSNFSEGIITIKDDVIHIAANYYNSGTRKIYYRKFTISTSTWGSVTDTGAVHNALQSILIDSDDNIYVFYYDYYDTNYIKCRKYTSSWADMNLAVAGATGTIKTVIDSDDNIYAFFSNGSYLQYAVYNGTSWGSATNIVASRAIIDAVIDNDDNIYIVYRYSDTSKTYLCSKKWNGTSWGSEVSILNFYTSYSSIAYSVSLAIDKKGYLYLVYYWTYQSSISENKFVYRRSTNGGSSWDSETLLVQATSKSDWRGMVLNTGISGAYVPTEKFIHIFSNQQDYDMYLTLPDGLIWDTITPTVTTQSCDQIDKTSVRGNGNITDTGGENCTRRGFCYKVGTSGDPTVADSVAYDDGSFGTGAFTKSITGLSAGTSYRVRAYAVNSAGTSYGTTVDVKTLSSFIPRTMWFN